MMWTLTARIAPGAPDNAVRPIRPAAVGAHSPLRSKHFSTSWRRHQDEHVALVSYSSNTKECGYHIPHFRHQLGPGQRLSAIRSAMKSSSKPVKGSTSISAGHRRRHQGADRQKDPPVRREDNDRNDRRHPQSWEGADPLGANAAKKDIVIHTITFSSDADIKRMEAVAAATGGKHFHARSSRRTDEDLSADRLDAPRADYGLIGVRASTTRMRVSQRMKIITPEDTRAKSIAGGATAVEFAMTVPIFFCFCWRRSSLVG